MNLWVVETAWKDEAEWSPLGVDISLFNILIPISSHSKSVATNYIVYQLYSAGSDLHYAATCLL